jgi:hypothetical protein
MLPVVFDYYWNFASSSPYVKYRKLILRGQVGHWGGELSSAEQEQWNQQRDERMIAAHERHAPEIAQSHAGSEESLHQTGTGLIRVGTSGARAIPSVVSNSPE